MRVILFLFAHKNGLKIFWIISHSHLQSTWKLLKSDRHLDAVIPSIFRQDQVAEALDYDVSIVLINKLPFQLTVYYVFRKVGHRQASHLALHHIPNKTNTRPRTTQTNLPPDGSSPFDGSELHLLQQLFGTVARLSSAVPKRQFGKARLERCACVGMERYFRTETTRLPLSPLACVFCSKRCGTSLFTRRVVFKIRRSIYGQMRTSLRVKIRLLNWVFPAVQKEPSSVRIQSTYLWNTTANLLILFLFTHRERNIKI